NYYLKTRIIYHFLEGLLIVFVYNNITFSKKLSSCIEHLLTTLTAKVFLDFFRSQANNISGDHNFFIRWDAHYSDTRIITRNNTSFTTFLIFFFIERDT